MKEMFLKGLASLDTHMEARHTVLGETCLCIQCQLVLCPGWRLTGVPVTEAGCCVSSLEMLSEMWVIGFCFETHNMSGLK